VPTDRIPREIDALRGQWAASGLLAPGGAAIKQYTVDDLVDAACWHGENKLAVFARRAGSQGGSLGFHDALFALLEHLQRRVPHALLRLTR
jgi:hypothetical protein